MKGRHAQRTTRLCTLSLLLAGLTTDLWAGDAHWPSFRGHRARGVAERPVPETWNLATGEHVRWKVPVPGLAHASPIVWGDRLFVVTVVAKAGDPELRVGLYGSPAAADDDGVQQWWAYALDRHDGAILWRRLLHEGSPETRRHAKATHANATPATDGKRLVVFLGSEGLFALDLDGQLLWQKDFGVLSAGSFRMQDLQWGFGNSPVLHDDKVVVLADVHGESFLTLLDAQDGRALWRVVRDDVPTWGAPTVYEDGESTRIAVNGFRHIGGYDFETGAEVWRMKGGGDVPVPTPIVGDGQIFIANAHGRLSPVYAVRAHARGDVSLAAEATSNEHVAWADLRAGAYMQTPLLHDGLLYVCRDNGVLKVYDAKTGAKHYDQRLPSGGDGFSASPVAAGHAVYLTSEMGDVHVIKAGPTYEHVASNPLDEVTMATPAIAPGTIYFRTRGHVIAIGGSEGSKQRPRP